MNLIRKLWCEGEALFSLSLALVATLVLGLSTWCATAGTAAAAPRAPIAVFAQGEAIGTLPYHDGDTITVGARHQENAAFNNDGTITVTWRSGGDEIVVTVKQQPAEGDDAFAARAHRKVDAVKLAFPRDP